MFPGRPGIRPMTGGPASVTVDIMTNEILGPVTATPQGHGRRLSPSTRERPLGSLWKAAGILALAHLALMFATTALRGSPTVHPGQQGVEHSFVEASLTRDLAGGYVQMLACLILIPVIVFLSRAVGRRTELGSWMSGTAAAAALGYVFVLVVGLAAGAASSWGRRQGMDLDESLAINNIRNFGYLAGPMLLGLHAIGLAIAARSDGLMGRWVGWGGLVVGVLLVLVPPAAAVGVPGAILVWAVWWAGLGGLMLRHQDTAASGARL